MAKRGRPRRSGATMMFLLWAPTITGALGLGAIANQWVPGAITGAIIGFVIGVALMAFPDLDRGGPDDTEDLFH